MPLKNKIIAWLKGNNYWLQYAGNRLLEGEKIDENLVNSTYKLFKEDYGLQPIESDRSSIEFDEIEFDAASAAGNLELKLIKEISNVNALATGQAIQVNSKLTIIYGANGTGKSGYVRLLNNVFNSRGDKHILPNVFSADAIGEPTCKFTFQADAEPYELTYPAQKSNTEFSQYSVFDTQSIRAILEQDNKLDFTPIGFEFFEKILELYEAIKTKLNAEINANKPTNEFLKFFNNENAIKNVILKLGANSNEHELRALGLYTEENATQLAELTAKREVLKALDIPKKIRELQKLLSSIQDFVTKQQEILECLTIEEIEQYQNLINTFHKFQDLAKQEGIKSLEDYNIEKVGSNEWKEFIKASKNYTTAIEANRHGKTYPSEKDNCVFCLQPLSEKETDLISSYWKLLKSEAESELNRVTQTIKALVTKLSALTLVKFDETTTIFEYVNSKDVSFATRWKNISTKTEKSINNTILNLTNKTLDNSILSFTVTTEEFTSLVATLEIEIEELFKKNPSKEIAELEAQIQFLTDKSLLNKLLEQVLNFVLAHKWAAKAGNSASALNTKSVTIKQGELFSVHITDKYTETFNNECKILNAPKVVQIAQRNARGATLRKLQVAGKVANSVLSEGEQRAISLADFLTEVQLNPYNKGIFFDDPVTSQDHLRREKIAERLVELAKHKQVVIFTHDIAFFIRLKILAETKDVSYESTTLRNIGGTPGIINPELPWIAQPIKTRIGTLKNSLVQLKKIEKSGDEDKYFYEAKTWYGLLREGWERAVEERLFKGVVERFSLGIQTQKLKKVEITDELLNAIEKGMTDSSSWVHDAGAGLQPTPPDTTKAEMDLNALEEFAKKCVPA